MVMAELPIASAKEEIRVLLEREAFLVVVGDTGSGKTTQLPSYLLDWDPREYAPVAITQPRRVAATSVSARVARLRGTELGGAEVGYKVRFDDRTRKSRLTFMTDGVLVRECVGDPELRKYKTIMLDEAHERSVETDVLFGLVKAAVRKRSDLKCIVASATLDAEKFCAYFDDCPLVRVPGRAFPVDVYHSKTTQTMTRYGPASRQYVDKAVEVAAQIHRTQPLPGHVLVFLTGQDEIERACRSLRELFFFSSNDDANKDDRQGGRLIVLPLYGALPMDAADRVFEAVDDATTRKIVVATNVAETSITVPGVRYVVDAGYVKLKGFEPRRAVASLTVVPVSKVAAEQRAGRAGRTGPGQCYRLYSKASFDNMFPETIPEIKRTTMTSVVLALKSLGVSDVLSFDFLDPPDATQLACALIELHALGALRPNDGSLSPLGRALSSLALEPNVARALVEAAGTRRNKVKHTVLAVAALLSSEDVWYSPRRRRQRRRLQGPATAGENNDDDDEALDDESRAAHAAFRHERGDLFSLATVYDAFCVVDDATRGQGEAMAWATRHFLRYRALRFARKAFEQLKDEVERFVEPRIASLDLDPLDDHHHHQSDDDALVARALTYGLCLNAAERGTHKEAFVLLPGPGPTLDKQLEADPDLLGLPQQGEGLPPTVAVVRVEDDTAAAFRRTPEAFCFHELKLRNNRGSFAHNVVVVDPDLLRHARRHIGHATVRQLSGRPPLTTKKKGKRVVKDEDPKGGSNDASSTTPGGGASSTDLDAARHRFLERKRAKTPQHGK